MGSVPLRRLASAARSALARPDKGPPPNSQPGPWDPLQTSPMYAWCRANKPETRPQYLWPLIHATHVARALGIPSIAALEFGVAGGNGLLAMEQAAAIATDLSGTEVEIYGFDTGSGMPEATDPRDAPFLIEPTYFAMDEQALRARLTHAELVLGPVRDTVPTWLAESPAPPVGFVAFDLDYYSSTREAFALLEAEPKRIMPRVLCYFDDTFGYGWTDFMGVHAAIAEYNESHERKIGKIHGLRFELPRAEFHEQWHEKLYVFHAFDHPRYPAFEGKVDDRWFEAHRLSPQ